MNKDPSDMELPELLAEVKRISRWLDDAFTADCSEDDCTEGCASCDAGIAIKYLKKISSMLTTSCGVKL